MKVEITSASDKTVEALAIYDTGCPHQMLFNEKASELGGPDDWLFDDGNNRMMILLIRESNFSVKVPGRYNTVYFPTL